MLIKSIIATLIGASVTGGAVYVAQNPEVLEPIEAVITTPDEPSDNITKGEEESTAKPSNVALKNTDDEKSVDVASKKSRDDAKATKDRKVMTSEDLLKQIDQDAKSRLNYDAKTRAGILDCLRVYTSPETMEASDFSQEEALASLIACGNSAKASGNIEVLPNAVDTAAQDRDAKSEAAETRRANRVARDNDRRLERERLRERAARRAEANERSIAVEEEADKAPLSFIDSVLAHSEKIENLELRDQAYLDIVDYALRRDDFTSAEGAMGKLNDMALRDTARNRIAIKYALSGESDMAFAVIDSVENISLKDYMRLQVIEALVVPERLPKGVVPQ